MVGRRVVDKRISGHAALYNSEAVIAGLFRETILPGAFTAAIGRDDVRCLFNHSPDYVLGRTKSGTLTLSEDARGLRYPRWTAENPPLIDTSNPAISDGRPRLMEFYLVASSVRKSVWTLVRQLRGPHLRTWA